MSLRRAWPAVAIVVLLAAWLARTWLAPDVMRQERNIQTLIGAGSAVILLLFWLVAMSGLSRRLRFGVLALVLVPIAALASLLRIRGVSGDLVPILDWRWPPREAPAAPAMPSPEPSAALPSPMPAPAADATATADVPETVATPPPRRPGDYPQFLGPHRDGTLRGLRLARDWSARPPRKLWRRRIGEGWSGFAVVGERAVTQEQRGAEERVTAYDLRTGRALWTHADAARYDELIAGVGPRATPAIAEGRVFTMGATGLLNALDLATGRALWTRPAVEENGGQIPQWGKSGSPLVVGSRVVVSAGGPDGHSLVAYDAATGAVAWRGGSDRSSYSSPFLARLGGRAVLVVLNDATLAGHDPETGAVLFEHAWPAGQPSVAVPALIGGDRLLVSAGYGVGSKAYRVAALADGSLQATMEWESPRLKSKFANLVVHRGLVFGLDDGVLTCLDPATGERRWKGGRYGHGQLLLVDDLLLVQTEEGEVRLLEPGPEGAPEHARFPALDGKTWNPPALAGSILLVRNDREAAAYDLPVD
jgi:outer membrane protein assembly factor BamB